MVSWGDGAQLGRHSVLAVLGRGFGKLVGSVAPGASDPGTRVSVGQRVLPPLLGYSWWTLWDLQSGASPSHVLQSL